MLGPVVSGPKAQIDLAANRSQSYFVWKNSPSFFLQQGNSMKRRLKAGGEEGLHTLSAGNIKEIGWSGVTKVNGIRGVERRFSLMVCEVFPTPGVDHSILALLGPDGWTDVARTHTLMNATLVTGTEKKILHAFSAWFNYSKRSNQYFKWRAFNKYIPILLLMHRLVFTSI